MGAGGSDVAREDVGGKGGGWGATRLRGWGGMGEGEKARARSRKDRRCARDAEDIEGGR